MLKKITIAAAVLGLSLGEIIERVTLRPARVVDRTDLGTLAPGSAGDATVLKRQVGRFTLRDCTEAVATVNERWVLRDVIRAGQRWGPSRPPSAGSSAECQ